MKIWLDDKQAAPDGWFQAKNVEEAQKAIIFADTFNVFDALSIDPNPWPRHGDRIFLLSWMAEHEFWPKIKPTIHNSSAFGAFVIRRFINRHYPRERST